MLPTSSPDPARDLSNTLERSADNSPATASPPVGVTTPPRPAQPLTPASVGLSTVQKCSTTRQLAKAITPIIAEKFSLDDATMSRLGKQLNFYFSKVGVSNDSIFAMMKNKSDWPDASAHTTANQPLDLITIPVALLLCEIAGYMEQAIESKFFLVPGVTYKSLSSWAKAKSDPGRHDARGSHSSTTLVSGASSNQKMPSFKVDRFEGDAFSGDAFVRKVIGIFASNAVSSYLSDSRMCRQNLPWSGAFASRIRESIAESPILGFIATELETEENCAKVWSRVCQHLTKTDVMIGRVLGDWQDFFKLRCENKEDFLEFYSSAKKILHRLKVAKSVAVSDDSFLRSFFAKAIDVPELQEATKQFLKQFNVKTEDILESVHNDYRSIETRERLEEGSIGSSTGGKSTSRRANPMKTPIPKKASVVTYRKFPLNSGNLIPPEYYKQVKEWYDHAVKGKDKTEEDEKWLSAFKFKHLELPAEKGPWKRKPESNSNKQHYSNNGYKGRRGHSSRTDYDSEDYEDYKSFRDWKSRRGRRGDSEDRSRRSPSRDHDKRTDTRDGRTNDRRAAARRTMFGT